MPDLDIAVWTHEDTDRLSQAIASIGKHCHFSFNLVVVCEPGTVPENMKRVLDRSKSRFLMFFEDDLELLDPHTIPRLRQILFEKDEIAVACPDVVTEREKVTEYLESKKEGPWCSSDFSNMKIRTIVPAAFMFDREKVPDLYIETDYPETKYWYDVDLCFQAVSRGYRCAREFDVCLFHNQRPVPGAMCTPAGIRTVELLSKKWDVTFPINTNTIPKMVRDA